MKLKNEEKYYHKGHINPVSKKSAFNIFLKLIKGTKTMHKPKQTSINKIL